MAYLRTLHKILISYYVVTYLLFNYHKADLERTHRPASDSIVNIIDVSAYNNAYANKSDGSLQNAFYRDSSWTVKDQFPSIGLCVAALHDAYCQLLLKIIHIRNLNMR